MRAPTPPRQKFSVLFAPDARPTLVPHIFSSRAVSFSRLCCVYIFSLSRLLLSYWKTTSTRPRRGSNYIHKVAFNATESLLSSVCLDELVDRSSSAMACRRAWSARFETRCTHWQAIVLCVRRELFGRSWLLSVAVTVIDQSTTVSIGLNVTSRAHSVVVS